jgi:hypothetical protein
LDELCLAAGGDDGLKLWIDNGRLGADRRRDRDVVLSERLLVVDAYKEVQEVDRLGRRVLADRDSVRAADRIGCVAGPTVNGREWEPSESVADAVLARAVGLLGSGSPWPYLVAALALPNAACRRSCVALVAWNGFFAVSV